MGKPLNWLHLHEGLFSTIRVCNFDVYQAHIFLARYLGLMWIYGNLPVTNLDLTNKLWDLIHTCPGMFPTESKKSCAVQRPRISVLSTLSKKGCQSLHRGGVAENAGAAEVRGFSCHPGWHRRVYSRIIPFQNHPINIPWIINSYQILYHIIIPYPII